MNFFIPLGIPNGLSKYTSEKFLNEKEEIQKILLNSTTLVLIPTIFFTVFIFIVSDQISYFLFDTIDYSFYIKLISISIPIIVLNSMIEGMLRALNVIGTYSRVSIYSNIIGILILIPLVLFFKLLGAIIAILILYLLYSLIGIYFLLKLNILNGLKWKFNIDKELAKKLLKVSFVFLVSGGLFQFTLLLLRKFIISDFGIFYNGIYQSTIALSLNYFSFIFISLSTYSFPLISKINSNEKLTAELNVNVKYICLLMIPLISIIFAFRFNIIEILFTKEFIESQKLFLFQFTGDFFKAIAWAVGIWLVPKLKLKKFLYLELLLNVNLIVIFLILNSLFPEHLTMISIAYMLSYIIHSFLNIYIARTDLNFKFDKSNKKIFITTFFLTLPCLIVSYFEVIIGIYLIVPSLILWAYLILEKNDIRKFKELIIGFTK